MKRFHPRPSPRTKARPTARTPAGGLDRAAKIAAIAKDVVTMLALMVGGGWALIHFKATLQAEQAAAGLEKVVADLEEIKRRLEGEANVDIAVAASQVCSDLPFAIDVRTTLLNRGTRSALLDFRSTRDSGLFAVRYSLLPNSRITFSGSYPAYLFTFDPTDPNAPSDLGTVDLQPGVTTKLHYRIAVPSAGTYLVSFVAPMLASDRQAAQKRIAREAPGVEPVAYRWRGRDYVIVTADHCPRSPAGGS